MRLDWLGYPETVLALWCPVSVVGLWRLASVGVARLGARERFMVAFGAAVTPLFALMVPYVPDSPLRNALPWRPPLGWGISNWTVDGDMSTFASAVTALATVAPLLSLAVSFVAGGVQVVRTKNAIRRLGPRRCGDVWVVDSGRTPAGFVACTEGLLRPRVIVGSAMLESPEATTIVSHERSHARARHPLLIFFATCALRSWWWIPGYRRLLRQLSTAAELWADHDTRVAVGAPSVARALHAHLSSELSIAGGSWVGFSDPHIELRQRIAALASPLSVASTCQKYLVRCGVVLAMIVVVVLL